MTTIIWLGFLAFIFGMIAIDLGVFHRTAHAMKVKEALTWTFVWVSLAMAFNVFVYFLYREQWLGFTGSEAERLSGSEAALKFFTGYLVEYSLSVDNIFVIAMIVAFFRVPSDQQHRLLFWGVMGAVVMRGIMIGLGTALIARFDWIMYFFGALLIASAARMLVMREDNFHPDRNLFVRIARRLFRVSSHYEGSRFFTRVDGCLAATPMFLALILVETSDVMFAVDSIPAIFAITQDPFIIFTSNIFAIMGLRSLYFALAGLMDKFRYLKTSLVFLLAFIGVKMILKHHYEISDAVSLAVIGGILAVGVLASLLAAASETRSPDTPITEEEAE